MQREPDNENQIDDAVVERYFDGAGGTSAAAMSMMAHEFNLPSNALGYRLSQELKSIGPWLDTVGESGRVLDVGCGAGAWVEIFANRYQSAVGVERSSLMVEDAKKRVAGLPNAQILQGDGRQDLPAGPYELIFLFCVADRTEFHCESPASTTGNRINRSIIRLRRDSDFTRNRHIGHCK